MGLVLVRRGVQVEPSSQAKIVGFRVLLKAALAKAAQAQQLMIEALAGSATAAKYPTASKTQALLIKDAKIMVYSNGLCSFHCKVDVSLLPERPLQKARCSACLPPPNAASTKITLKLAFLRLWWYAETKLTRSNTNYFSVNRTDIPTTNIVLTHAKRQTCSSASLIPYITYTTL